MIVAFCNNNGIGYKNTIPWRIKKDMLYFKKLTMGNGNNAVIMGSNTLLSIPYKNDFFQRLPKRDSLILSSSLQNSNVFKDIQSLKKHCENKNYDDIWVIGRATVYDSFINEVDEIYITRVRKDYNCDTFFPKIPNYFNLNSSSIIFKEKDITFIFEIYKKLEIK